MAKTLNYDDWFDYEIDNQKFQIHLLSYYPGSPSRYYEDPGEDPEVEYQVYINQDGEQMEISDYIYDKYYSQFSNACLKYLEEYEKDQAMGYAESQLI